MLSKLWGWATNNAVAALTLGGLLLYALLRLPYSIYYGALGTSPEDVGLSYVETLARSTAGLTAAAVAIGVVAAAVAAVLTFLTLYWRLVRANIKARSLSDTPYALMTDEEYAGARDDHRLLLVTVLRGAGDQVERWLRAVDTNRRLLRLGVRDRRQQAEADEIAGRSVGALVRLVRQEATRKARAFGALGAAGTALSVIVVLPFVAYQDAEGVRGCSKPLLGQFGLFAIRGARADIYRINDDGSTTRMLPDRTSMYLGTDGDRLVLFDCQAERVLRFPAADVLVASG